MATYIRGNDVSNATEYVLLERDTIDEIGSLGIGSQDLFSNTSTGYLAGSAAITGYVFGIGIISADKKIVGARIVVSPTVDSSSTVTHATKIYAKLYTVESLPLASNGRVAFSTVSPTLVASGSADISVAINANVAVDVTFDEPYYNTNGKFLMLGYNLDTGCKRRKASPDITGAAACEVNDGNAYEPLYLWYSAKTDATEGWSPGYDDTTALAYTLLTYNKKLIDTYTEKATASEINFEVSAMELEPGDHVFAVKARAEGYTDSNNSNEVTYTAT